MQEKSSIKRNILQFLDAKGISKYQFYKETGITRGVLDSDGGMSEENTAKFIAYYPNVNLEWLITGSGSMLKDTHQPNNKPKVYTNTDQVLSKVSEPEMTVHKLKTDYFGVDKQLIPLYEIEATAGLNAIFVNQSTQVPLDYISVPNAPKCDGALYIRGDSMYPVLKAGDIVCFKIIQDFQDVRFGEMYILDIEDNSDRYLTVKYIQKSDINNEYLKLVSQNINHQSKEEHKSHIKALAIVKVSIRYNTIS